MHVYCECVLIFYFTCMWIIKFLEIISLVSIRKPNFGSICEVLYGCTSQGKLKLIAKYLCVNRKVFYKWLKKPFLKGKNK